MTTAARTDTLRREDTRPADQRKAALTALLRDIAQDAHEAPTAYLRDTRVPGGGE